MKEEKTIEQALKDAAEQAGAKPEEMKTVAVEQVAGIHVFSSDMEKPPIVLIDGECMDVAALFGICNQRIHRRSGSAGNAARRCRKNRNRNNETGNRGSESGSVSERRKTLMGIMDAFKPEDRTEITYSNFYNLIKQAAQYEIVMNAVNCDVPHAYIRETMTGKKEEHKEEKTVIGAINVNFDSGEFKRITDETIKESFEPDGLEEIPTDHIQAGAKTGSRDKKTSEEEGEKNHGKNEPEI